MVGRGGRRRAEPGSLDPCLVAPQDHHFRRQRLHLFQRLGDAWIGGGTIDVHVEAIGPRRGTLRPRLQRHEVHATNTESLERERQHARLVVDQHDQGRLVPAGAGAACRQIGRIRPAEGQKTGLVGWIVLDPLGDGNEPVRLRGMPGGNGCIRRIALLRDDLGTAGRIPRAHQLHVGKVFREPDAALSQRHRMREDPPDSLELRARHRHDRVMHGEQNLMGEAKRPVSEGLLEEVVGGGDRADQRVLDGKAPGIRRARPYRGNHVLRLPAGQGGHLRPAAARRRVAEGAMGALDRNAHTYSLPG